MIATINRDWFHEHLGYAFKAKTSGTLWMLVSVNENDVIHFRTPDGDLLKTTSIDFAKALVRGDFEETEVTW